MPLVSIIVPVYNSENVLRYCVESILNQTFHDFELILIDDGSLDNSGEICDEYSIQDERVSVIHNKNKGVSSARNIGIKKSIGKYICFVDSDDYIFSDFLQRLIELKTLYSDFDNVWCGFQSVKSYETGKKIIQKIVYSNEEDISISGINEIMTLHEKWLDAGPYCKLFERKIIINSSIYFPTDLSLGEDLLFNFNYLDCTNGKIVILNVPLYNYVVINGDSLARRYYSNLFSVYKYINATMYSYLVKWHCDDRQYKKFFSACFYKYEVVLKNTFSVNNLSCNRDKYKYNNNILGSFEFQEAYKKGDFHLNIMYRLAYATKKYCAVKMVDRIFEILKKLFY